MFKLNPLLVLVMLFACCLGVRAQQISKEELLFLTPEWKGERFPDGRPKVPDAILDRIVHSSYTITIEGTDSMRKRKGLIK